MCNRYEQRGNMEGIRKAAKALRRDLFTTPATDNLRPLDSVYPDQDAPILRNMSGGGLQLSSARWGFPPIPGQTAPITNIRNLNSGWWKNTNREWLTKPEYRCLVPFSAFAEPVRDSTWFVVPDMEIAYFAGVWRPWQGERLAETPGKKRRTRQPGDWELFSFLTTEPNDIVRPIHEKAMPVILVDPAEQAEWLAGGTESLRLQRTLPNEHLAVRPRPEKAA